jgi:hypothetical protein
MPPRQGPASMPRHRRKRHRATAAFGLPSHWSPQQALAVFECLELIGDQLWLAYGPDIQRTWREQLVIERSPLDFDPDMPF